MMFECVPGKIRGRIEMEFLHNACSIGADTFHAQREFFGNMRDGFAMGNQAEDLELAIRKPGVGRLIRITLL